MLSQNQVSDLIDKIKSGDKNAIEDLVENYRGYVIATATRMGRNRDELISAGFLGLLKAIDNINNFKEGNFLAFASTYIKSEIKQEFYSNIFGPCFSTILTRRNRKQEPHNIRRVPIARDGEPIQTDIPEDGVLRQGWSRCRKLKSSSDLKETIYEILKTDLEKQIIDCKINGLSHRETAELCGCSLAAITRILNKIYERLENEFGSL